MTKAYISATLEDLKECRQAVRNALSQLELGFKTMEVYVAEGRAPLERCLKDIDACEIYIGIFAWRYGYIPLGETKSITHLEFEHAVRSNKHCLIFLLDDKALWPVLHVDRGPAAAKVDELRRIVSAAYLCKFFTSADQRPDIRSLAALHGAPLCIELHSGRNGIEDKRRGNAVRDLHAANHQHGVPLLLQSINYLGLLFCRQLDRSNSCCRVDHLRCNRSEVIMVDIGRRRLRRFLYGHSPKHARKKSLL